MNAEKPDWISLADGSPRRPPRRVKVEVFIACILTLAALIYIVVTATGASQGKASHASGKTGHSSRPQ